MPLTINPSLFKKLNYDPGKDVAPVSLLLSAPHALVVLSGLVKKTIADFDLASESDRPTEKEPDTALAPAAAEAFPGMTKALGRVEQLRRDVLEALAPGDATLEARQKRAERLRGVARRYGLPVSGIGAAQWP
jgi:hypothetical protein